MNIDVLPASWRTAIGRASVTIDVPDDMNWSEIRTYSGPYGSLGSKYGRWQVSKNDHRIRYSAENLPDHSGATVYAVLPDGYWDGALSFRTTDLILILVLIAAAAALFFIRRSTESERIDIVETVEFYPPDGMTPVELAAVIDGSVSEQDITAMLFVLAQKGVLKIEDLGARDYRFTKLAEPAPGYEEMYFKAIFGRSSDKVKIGSWTKLSTAKKHIGKRYDMISEAVTNEFTGSRELYSSRSRTATVVSYVIFFAASFIISYTAAGLSSITGSNDPSCFEAAFVVAVFFSTFLGIGSSIIENRRIKSTACLIFSAGICFAIYAGAAVFDVYSLSKGTGLALRAVFIAFCALVPFLIIGEKKRTPWGAEIYGRAVGFRNFLEKAEAPRIRALIDEDPDYCSEMLPYAYSFRLLKKWQRLFADLGIAAPAWYAASVYSGGTLASDLNSIGHDIGSEVHETSSSFGSDGGSGGGGGGGGGGSW